jgi:hypothetical protein
MSAQEQSRMLKAKAITDFIWILVLAAAAFRGHKAGCFRVCDATPVPFLPEKPPGRGAC